MLPSHARLAACTLTYQAHGSIAALLVSRVTFWACQMQICGESQEDHSGFCLGLAVGNPFPEKGFVISVGKDQ